MKIIIPHNGNRSSSIMHALGAVKEFINKMDLNTMSVYMNNFLDGNDISIEIPLDTPDENFQTLSHLMERFKVTYHIQE